MSSKTLYIQAGFDLMKCHRHLRTAGQHDYAGVQRLHQIATMAAHQLSRYKSVRGHPMCSHHGSEEYRLKKKISGTDGLSQWA